MFPLYNNQNVEFDDVRLAIQRFFGSQSIVTIHDGDGCELFDRVSSHYGAGTVSNPHGNTIASFAIQCVSDETSDGDYLRHVVGVHLGLPGQWCHNQRDASTFRSVVDQLACRYPLR